MNEAKSLDDAPFKRSFKLNSSAIVFAKKTLRGKKVDKFLTSHKTLNERQKYSC